MTNNTMAPKKKRGAPKGTGNRYTKILGEQICERLAQGETLKAICDELKLGMTTIYRWQGVYPEFAESYARAREFQARSWFEEMIQAAKTPEYGEVKESGVDGEGNTWEKTKREDQVAHRRLKIDTLKWAVSKILPREYGDRVTTEIVGKDGGAIETKVDHGVGGLSSDQLAAIALLKTSNE